jgi:predicted nucleic acid-binding Zn ribbon protein
MLYFGMKKITTAVDRIVTRIAGERALEEYRAFQSWNEIVGDVIAHAAVPVKVIKGVLYVSVKNSTWRQELMMQKPEILNKFASRFGPDIIKDIRLH